MEWLEVDEAELLCATLADWDGSVSDPLVAPAEPITERPQPGVTEKRQGRATNLTRERRKREMAYLKTKHEELTRQLETLQRRRNDQLQAHYDTKSGCITSTAPVWEAIARRQFEARKRAEEANARLKEMLSTQAHVARDLLIQAHQVAHKTTTSAASIRGMLGTPMPSPTSRRLPDHESHQRVDTLMTQWETVFSLNEKFSRPCVDVWDTRIVPTFDRAVVLEATACLALPFPVQSVEEATWALCQEQLSVTDAETCTHDLRVTDDTISGVFSSEVRLDAIRGTLNGRLVTKKYKATPTQRLFVTHIYYEPQGFLSDMDDVTVREDSWIRLVDANELTEHRLDAPLTMLQYVQRTRIGLENHRGGTQASVAEKASFFVALIEAEMNSAHQTLDKLLMQPKEST